MNDRRIGVWEDADGDGSGDPTQRWTVYDGDNPYADFDGSGALTNKYLYGPAIDQIIARADIAGNVDWYLTDYLGSVRQLVQTDGTVVDEISYDSFGKILSETNASAGDRFKYTAREWDALTAQYFYRARYFGPDTGRFTQEDPIRFAAGDSNLYRYVGNSPIGRVDPTGHQWIDGQWTGAGPPPPGGPPLWPSGPQGRTNAERLWDDFLADNARAAERRAQQDAWFREWVNDTFGHELGPDSIWAIIEKTPICGTGGGGGVRVVRIIQTPASVRWDLNNLQRLLARLRQQRPANVREFELWAEQVRAREAQIRRLQEMMRLNP